MGFYYLLINIVIKNLVLDLILALLAKPAARILRSRIGNGTLDGDLGSLYVRVVSDQCDIALAIPLVDYIVRIEADAPSWNDVDIWDAVYEFVARSNAGTPPIALERTLLDTPLRSSSASQGGIEQTHNHVDQQLRQELTGRVYYDVGGFFERYFEKKSWSNKAEDIYAKTKAQYAESRWNGWPEPSLQSSFFEWFIKFQDAVLTGLGCRYYTSANKALTGSEADRKLDIFLAPVNVAPTGEHDWSNVLVIGEHKQNPVEDYSIKTLIQLAGYAREVFGSQPDRRFVPGFTICGSLMRLWVFDRSGPYNSEKFDIHKEPERFVKVIAGYGLMSDAELGLNTFIKRDENGKYILAQDARIYLENKPIASTKAIVCRGTTCYRGKRSDSPKWEYVAKFVWPSDKRQREGTLLKLAKDRGVTGISDWFSHEQITIEGDMDTISHLRRAMKFGMPRRLWSKGYWVDDGTESSRTSRTKSVTSRSKSTMDRLTDLGIGTSSITKLSSRQKRKRDEGSVDENGGVKRSRLRDGRAHVEVATNAENEDPDTTDLPSIQEPEIDSLVGFENETYGNRIHYCLVVSPAGRPLHAYRSTKELLEALRDAIKGHRSLLENGKILHRDISENNIIIAEAASEGDPKGILIDLDLAKELDSVTSGASHRTGTMQFMAIEVLEGRGHTYRHDLESLFYVFTWMCIRYGSEDTGDWMATSALGHRKRVKATTTSILRDWYTGNYKQIANAKRGHMDKNGFENVVAEFAPRNEDLKQLARELRNVLFPIRDGAIFTGTLRDNDIMYDGMMNAFSRAIDRSRKEEQAIA